MDDDRQHKAGKHAPPLFKAGVSQTPMIQRHLKAKKQAIFFAGAGFMLVFLVSIPFIHQHAIDLSWESWFKAALTNLIIWSSFWLIVHFKLDRFVPFDPHFILLPAVASAVMICFLVYLVPDLRALVLGGWLAVLLFGSGLLGFIEAILLSSFMASAYIMTIYYLINKGENLSFTYELWMMLPLMIFWTFGAFVLERAKRNRDEKRYLRQQLSEMAFTDSLTNLPNRRAFTELMNNNQRSKDKTVIAVLDVDYFKQVNDQLGHEYGDRVLIDIGQIIRQGIRCEDMAARLGGDEFIILINHVELVDAHIMVERIRMQVEEKMQLLLAANKLTITLSIGLAQAKMGLDLKDVQRKADQALYAAKERGRNQTYYAGIL